MRRDPHPDHEAIRTLFLDPQDSYGLAQAARLLGVAASTLRREATADDPEAYQEHGVWRFRWRQLAYMAFRRWSLAQIHDALGADARAVLPPLLTLQPLTLKLPAYLLRAIEHSAAAERTTVDDWLYQELIDFAGTVAGQIERVVPGFRRAYLFPGQEYPDA
jgi:hypothetical protein